MSFLARLSLTWQSVCALGLFLAFGAYVLHLNPGAIPQLLALFAPGAVLALAAPSVVKPKPPEAQ